MSLKMLTLFLAVVLAVPTVPRASGQSGSCMSALVSLSPCLNYITGNVSTPSSSCCSQLASVVQAEPQCLCLVLNGNTSSLGITVNRTLALGLPTAFELWCRRIEDSADGIRISWSCSSNTSPFHLLPPLCCGVRLRLLNLLLVRLFLGDTVIC